MVALAKVISGASHGTFALPAGTPISVIRASLTDAFNIAEAAVQFVDGREVCLCYRIRSGDTIEFVVPWGRKGADRLFTKGNSKLGNSVFIFNIPVIATCPGRTEACESVCYADWGYFRFPANRQRNQENLLASKSPDFVERAIEELRRRNARLVRVHSAGDFYDAQYIRNWRQIAASSPDTTFWAYTRSWRLPELLEELKLLAELPNFHLWFSADRDTGLPPRVKNVRACWLQLGDESPPKAQVNEMPIELIFPAKVKDRERSKRIDSALVCPTYNGTLAGAETTCETCGVCWKK